MQESNLLELTLTSFRNSRITVLPILQKFIVSPVRIELTASSPQPDILSVKLQGPFDCTQGKLNFQVVSLKPRPQLYREPKEKFLLQEGMKEGVF